LGGAGSDTIKGGKGNDLIDGGADHDVLFGNLGNDTFLVSDGLDEIDGGDGTDALDFSNVLAGIADSAATFSFYDMSQPPGVFDPVISWGDPVEKLEDVISVEKFIFGDFGGTLTVHGNSDDEIFVTRDSVTSSFLVGMAGNDTFRGGALLGDTVDYGLEADKAGILNLYGGNPRGALGVVVNLEKGRAIDFFGDRDRLIGIEKVTGALYFYDGVVGSNRGETITNAEFVRAQGGDDIVEVNATAYGMQGLLNIPNRLSNLAPGGVRDDGYFDGGAGVDTLVMTEGSFYVDLGKGQLMFAYSGPTAGGVLEVKAKNFENVTSLGTIIGSKKDNILIGGATNDDLRGRRGNDTLDGGDGADTIDGGRGVDTLSFGTVTTGVTVSLADGTGSGNRAEGDTYTNIENIIGTHGDDTLTGDDGDNVIDGERGKDVLDGGDHGAKGDTVSYRSSPYSVTVDLSAGTVDVALPSSVPFDWNDSITGFENVIGSMEALDILIGDGGANKLQGLDGNDDLQGKGGDDLLIGGRGDDTLTGGAGGDTFLFRRGDGNDTITDFAAAEDHIKIRGARDLADLDFTASGGDVEISFRNTTITVETVTLAEMQDADIFGF
ncbi:MAG TPA: hypothetical protein ENK63_05050, partial [Rhodobacterales bacterium]|nr:hypothetical protein [Rhodobacterales bacterium]